MILSVLGGTERRQERWDARYASPVITVLGHTYLDFRTANLGDGETEVVVMSLLGSIELVVPDDLPVFVTGITALGSRTVLDMSESGFIHGVDRATPDWSAATGRKLRLSVFSALGGVEVRRLPSLIGMEI
jgi:predicted membrane protein